MKKVLATGVTLGIFLSLPGYAHAQNLVNCDQNSQFKALCTINAGNFGNILGQIINIFFLIAVLIALAFLIWGGIKWITSGGDKANVEGARNHIIAAIVGLIIVFLSYFILNIVVYMFTGQSLFDLKIPKIIP